MTWPCVDAVYQLKASPPTPTVLNLIPHWGRGAGEIRAQTLLANSSKDALGERQRLETRVLEVAQDAKAKQAEVESEQRAISSVRLPCVDYKVLYVFDERC